jgi:hypothetical protein
MAADIFRNIVGFTHILIYNNLY